MKKDWVSKLTCRIGNQLLIVKWHRGLGSVSVSLDGRTLAALRLSELANAPCIRDFDINGYCVAVEIEASVRDSVLICRVFVEGQMKVEQSISAQEDYKVRINNLGELSDYSPTVMDTVRYGLIFFSCLLVSALAMTFFFNMLGFLDFGDVYASILFASMLSLLTLVAIPRLPVLKQIYDPDRMVRLSRLSQIVSRIEAS